DLCLPAFLSALNHERNPGTEPCRDHAGGNISGSGPRRACGPQRRHARPQIAARARDPDYVHRHHRLLVLCELCVHQRQPHGRDRRVRSGGGIDPLRDLVLAENETAPYHHMKARIILAIALFLGTPIGQAFACSQCFTAPDSKTTEHMAAAIWVMMGLIMSVM